MLYIKRFVVNFIEENCYLIYDETLDAAIIDCGAYTTEEKENILAFIQEKRLRVRHLLQTHCHFDHLFGAEFIHSQLGLKPRMHPEERDNYVSASQQMRMFLHREMDLPLPPIGSFFCENDTFPIGKQHIQVIHTPGHTSGGVCFYLPEAKVLFSGDSLFRHSIGRTDFPYGSEENLVRSIKEKILTLPKNVVVYPGHGTKTTIGEEMEENLYLQ